MIYRFFYQLSILGLVGAFRLAAIFHPKAAKWVKGRKNWRQYLRQELSEKIQRDNPTVWLHTSSLGEYEQGRPILEALKAQNPGINIVISFFSPSGFEIARHHKLANVVCYLPADTEAAARDMVSLINPDLVIWVKYEYWYNHLKTIHKMGIPNLLVSAIFQTRQPFFKWYGGWYRQMLGFFTHIFVQDSFSINLVKNFVPSGQLTKNGDTRFDRVIDIANNWSPIPEIEALVQDGSPVVVAGSTWPDDNKTLRHFILSRPDVLWIIAPHEVGPGIIESVFNRFDNAVLFSKLDQFDAGRFAGKKPVVIMDSIGRLSRLYKYATISYVGGGFSGTGVHNVLEPSVFGRPVVFGPEYEEYAEAVGLVDSGGALVVDNALELETKLNMLLTDNSAYEKAARAAAYFVSSHGGATGRVLDFIQRNRLLTRL